jgi:hypothetical protein
MLYCALLSLLVAFLSISVEASTVALGLNCSSINDHLDPFTHKFVTSCTDVTFCSGPVNGTCLPKLCRRDEFPFEYADGDVPAPPMCDKESFCPDEGSGCRPLAAVGNMCQLNRDEQCARPQNWQELASSQNNNGSICIKSTCMSVIRLMALFARDLTQTLYLPFRYANVTLGLPCTLEQTTYYDNVLQINNLVSRSNCRTPSLYCHPTDLTCESTKPIGSPCSADFECEEASLVEYASVLRSMLTGSASHVVANLRPEGRVHRPSRKAFESGRLAIRDHGSFNSSRSAPFC